MFYTVTEADITSLTTTAGGLIGDFMPIILVVIGIVLGMYVFKKITG